jgi:hypothetical protein
VKLDRKAMARRKHLFTPEPLPESLERAFSEIERPAPHYADAQETRAVSPRTAQNKRLDA